MCNPIDGQLRIGAEGIRGQLELPDVHPGCAQRLRTSALGRAGIAVEEVDACDAGPDKGLRARARATGVVARLQGDHRRAACRPRPRLAQCHNLRVRTAGRLGSASAHDTSVRVQNHRAYRRIGACCPPHGRARTQGPLQRCVHLGVCLHQR